MPVTGASNLFSGNAGDAILAANSGSVFIASGNAVVQISVTTGAELARFDLGTKVGALDVSASGRYVAVVEPDNGNRFALIDLVSGTVSHRAVIQTGGATTALRDISFAGDKSLLLSQQLGSVLRYDLATRAVTAAIPETKTATLISSDDHTTTYVIDASYFHRTAIYGATGVEALFTENPDPYGGASLPTVMAQIGAITRDGSKVYEGDGGFLRDSALTQLAQFDGGALGYAFSPSGAVLYSLGADGNLMARDAATGQIEAVYFVAATLKAYAVDAATQLGNVLQITDDGLNAVAITAAGVTRFELSKLVAMSTEGDDTIAIGNTLYGLGGNDTLGGHGPQTLYGGSGNDTYIADPGDRVIELANQGRDTVQTALSSYNLSDNVEDLVSNAAAGIATYLGGNWLNNTILGGNGDDTIDGLGGTDILSGGGGTDTLSFGAQSARGVIISLALRTSQATPGGGSVRISGFENLTGTQLDDVLRGDRNANTLEGWAGKDLLDGGAGADRMDGGNDDDIYIVDSGGDIVSESTGNGIDTVRASVNYALPDGIENLELTGTRDISGTGNSWDNRITGNSGNNLLNGGDGNDHLLGGEGDDTLVGNSTSLNLDSDILNGGAGNDTARYAAAIAGVNVSLLIGAVQDTGGAGADTLVGIENLVGSAFEDILTGNNAANRLDGGAGDDVLSGGRGDDTLNGGRGFDTASYADAGRAITADLALAGAQNTQGAGSDTLISIENLTGGARADTLAGNALRNVIEGGAGADRLEGRAGNDRLDGGTGQDVMIGGSGSDIYVVDTALDSVSETASGMPGDTLDAGGRDTVEASVTFSLAGGGARFVENLTLTGFGAINATGNDLANMLIGNSGSNRLDGGLGKDVMRGGAGDDTYVIDNVHDTVEERSPFGLVDSGGHDRVEAGTSYTLGYDGAAFVEDLMLTGTAATYGFGNALDNVINGNSGDNRLSGEAGDDVLKGGAGRDLMAGGLGADRFVWDALGDFGGMTNAAADVVQDFSSAQLDRIDLSAIDANATTADSNEAFTFIDTAAFSGVSGELRTWQSSTVTYLAGDTDGDKSADFMIRLTGLVTLAADDLVL